MKIVIVGGGIGGLATYLALQKYLSDVSPPVTIKVYESHPDPTSTTMTIGGGLGLAPNGMRAINDISGPAAEIIDTTGFHGSGVTLRNSKGKLLGRFKMTRKERYGYDQLFLARAEVHQAFVRQVPDSSVEWGKKVTKAKESDEGVELTFEDGSVESADLVIGADGVRSIIREAILGDGYDAEYQ
jgi:2-polyprenyl-6-methoxyphenol hydroxylase-like FAD-dependent oxidoreductase